MFRCRTLPLLAALFALLPLPTFAQTAAPKPSEKIVNMDVSNADLHNVVAVLERQTGIVAVVRDGPTPYKPVQIRFSDSRLAKVLRAVAESAEAKLTQNADGTYLFEPKDASALAPTAPTLNPGPRQVQIKVDFAVAGIADVDNLMTFHLVPGTLPDGRKAAMQYATGAPALQLYQTLIRTVGKIIQPPVLTTNDGVPASIQIDTQIPRLNPLNGNLTPQTGLTAIPRINADDSVTLQINLPTADPFSRDADNPPLAVQPHVTILHTFNSGDTLLMIGPHEIPVPGNAFSNHAKPTDSQELLIFLTPTILSEQGQNDAGGGQSVTVTP